MSRNANVERRAVSYGHFLPQDLHRTVKNISVRSYLASISSKRNSERIYCNSTSKPHRYQKTSYFTLHIRFQRHALPAVDCRILVCEISAFVHYILGTLYSVFEDRMHHWPMTLARSGIQTRHCRFNSPT
jgi:hypothetical protein